MAAVETKIPPKHVVLDVDGTLLDNYTPRPHLKEFLQFLFTDKRIASVSIWTASHGWWKEIGSLLVLPLLAPGQNFRFIWEGDRVTRRYEVETGQTYFVKRLRKFWRSKCTGMTRTNTIIIDDTTYTFKENRGNAIKAVEYNGSKTDHELIRIIKLLDQDRLNRFDVRQKLPLPDE